MTRKRRSQDHTIGIGMTVKNMKKRKPPSVNVFGKG